MSHEVSAHDLRPIGNTICALGNDMELAACLRFTCTLPGRWSRVSFQYEPLAFQQRLMSC